MMANKTLQYGVAASLISLLGAEGFAPHSGAQEINAGGTSNIREPAERETVVEPFVIQETDTVFLPYEDSTPLAVGDVIYTFAGEPDARELARGISNIIGLRPNFLIRAADIDNAAAVIRDGNRIVFYSPTFIEGLRAGVDGDWAALSVLAHEIGHHLQGHTVQPGRSRHSEELEADQFSGFIVQRLGGTLEQAQSAVRASSSTVASTTHPPRSARLEAIAIGWRHAQRTAIGWAENTRSQGNSSTTADDKGLLNGNCERIFSLGGLTLSLVTSAADPDEAGRLQERKIDITHSDIRDGVLYFEGLTTTAEKISGSAKGNAFEFVGRKLGDADHNFSLRRASGECGPLIANGQLMYNDRNNGNPRLRRYEISIWQNVE